MGSRPERLATGRPCRSARHIGCPTAIARGRRRRQTAGKRRTAKRTASLRDLFQHRPTPVVTLVVGLEIAVLERPPPAGVLSVPIDRLTQAVLEGDSWPPAGEPLELGGIERIAPVVAGTI